MATFRVSIDFNASMSLYIEAENMKEAENKAVDAVWDEDTLIDNNRNDIFIYSPTIDEIVEVKENEYGLDR